MAVPTFNQVFRPVLAMLDVSETALTRQEITASLAVQFSLTEEELRERIPSGAKTRMRDRTDWVLTELKDAGLIHNSPQNQWWITPQGRIFLKEHPDAIKRSELKQVSTKPAQVPDVNEIIVGDMEELTPGEQIAQGYQQLQIKLSSDILDGLKSLTPSDFERLVNRLLSEMGYGTVEQPQGFSGDHGVDGTLNQDALGLEKIYVQAKRWDNAPVGEPDIARFSGSLDLKGATKGVFITTSTFSAAAEAYIRNNRSNKIIRLINGQELAELMIKHGVGVRTIDTYAVKELDANYFAEV